jgi:SAM-dependent methyltransferase
MTGDRSVDDRDADALRLATSGLAAGDPTGWFERLYAEAATGDAVVPWDSGTPQRWLVDWADANAVRGDGRRAVVVGCGYGDDAEYVAGLGFDTDAFDIAETAIAGARRRFTGSAVRYRTADLLDPPPEWRRAFDLVVEIYTLQALPDPPRGTAVENVRELVAPGGTLLVIAARRPDGDPVEAGPPWPLLRGEVEAIAAGDLRPVRIERPDDGRRWRAESRRG